LDQVIAANYLSNLDKCLEQLGVERFLSTIGFDTARVHDPTAYLTMSEFKQVITLAYEHSNCPHLGLVVGQSLSIVNHGFLGYAAMSSPDLGTAIHIVLSYLNTRTRLLRVELYPSSNDMAYLHLVPRSSDALVVRFITEMALIHLIRMRAFLLGTLEPCPGIELSYAKPTYSEYYEELFQTQIVFNVKQSMIWIRARELSYPLNYADDVSFQLAKTQLQQLSHGLSANDDLPSKIKSILLNGHLNHLCMDEVASTLCLTSRTLRRHLQKLDISYQELLDEVRQKKAISLLLNNSLALTEICFLLGFYDASGFSKAFKRWTGHTPTEYREQHGIT
jgi:AraC-like DNA-binding protein